MLPRRFREAAFALETNENLVGLVRIENPGWDSDLRFSTHRGERFSTTPLREGTTHDNAQYEYRVLSMARPDDAIGALPSVALVIESVDQDLGYLADEDLSGATVFMRLVLRSDPEAIVDELPDFKIMGVTLTETAVALEVSLDPIEQEASPSYLFTPQYCPALF